MAALDAQYGSASSNGDTGIEGARRDASISTRDAQYYASRDTSWAGTLSGSATLGNTPWTLKAIASANAQAAYSTNRARAQAAHDAALLSAMNDWQTSNRPSTLSLLLAEGQSREAYNKATATVYANWEMGVGNLLGDKPAGTSWEKTSVQVQSNITGKNDDSAKLTDFGKTQDESSNPKPGMSAGSQGNLPSRPTKSSVMSFKPGDGHHKVPQELWDGMPEATKRFFDMSGRYEKNGARIHNEYYNWHNGEQIKWGQTSRV